MAELIQLFLKLVSILLLFFISNAGGRSRYSVCGGTEPVASVRPSRNLYESPECNVNQLRCSSGKCINRNYVCDGDNDCGDNSDEENCNILEDISVTRQADVTEPRKSAVSWITRQSQISSMTEKWGPLVHKFAVALYLTDPQFASASSPTRIEMAYEMSIQLLSRLALKDLKDLSSPDLASFINGLLVTCLDPRYFYGIDLLQELRTRVDNSNYTSPYLLLTLCNAGDIITELDKKKLNDSFWSSQREFWTDIRAIAVMAMACAEGQSEKEMDLEKFKEFTIELKKNQYRNGTVESLQTTALVLQALNSVELDEDPDNFDDTKALEQILSHQQPDGSFGDFMKTYYVLPVLACKSLVNISYSHCQRKQRNEDSAVHYLVNQPFSKAKIQYSLWIGDERDVERTLTMNVPVNTSFYGIMEIASAIDFKYKFEYTVKNRKPYINSVSDILDDAESGVFWFPYIIQNGKPEPIEKSPADIIPKENDHLVMWYRQASWSA